MEDLKSYIEGPVPKLTIGPGVQELTDKDDKKVDETHGTQNKTVDAVTSLDDSKEMHQSKIH